MILKHGNIGGVILIGSCTILKHGNIGGFSSWYILRYLSMGI